jgi:hypothetical protein
MSDKPEMSQLENLADPFDAHEVKWKPQVVRANRAMAIAYVDARVVEDRLDEVFGVDGWQDGYQVLPNNNVICKLRVKIDDEWIEKSDVGSQSDQPDEGDRMKAAFSDALKRAAVKLGIGRYLYRLPQQWVDYDAQTRQIKVTPKLPDWAQPSKSSKPQKVKSPVAEQPETISRDQWEEVKQKLVFNGVPQRKLLEHFGYQKPGEIPAERFAELLEWPAKYAAEHPQAAPA